MRSIRDTFDRIVCINLDRRPDRWRRLQEHIATMDWPFASVERFSAVDGRTVTPPSWWRGGSGAWGCLQSHVLVMRRAIDDGVESLLILEDDAVLIGSFAEWAAVFLSRLPATWDGLMLGGQHLMPPQIISPGVLRVRNGNRTHAYALRGRYLAAAHAHLCNLADHARHPRFHIDHRLGQLHERGEFAVYAPEPWLIGQAAGPSDVAGNQSGQRFWPLEPKTPPNSIPETVP